MSGLAGRLGLPVAQAQTPAGLQQNTVTVLEARGDSLFAGPCLNLTTDGGASFQRLAPEEVCGASPRRLQALDVEGEAVFAGLSRTAPGATGTPVNAAAGFLASGDGGQTFSYRPPQLDSGPEDTVRYGVNVLPALPVVVPAGSAPAAVDYAPGAEGRPGVLWVAGGASGLRRSADGGQTFERVVLPPDSLGALSPSETYQFTLQPRRDQQPGGFFNHTARSVLVDETGTVWAGTSAGVNRSRPADVFTFERPDGTRFRERAWRRFGFANTADTAGVDSLGAGLSGNRVRLLREQPLSGRRNPVWMVTLTSDAFLDGERNGVTYTRDGGQTFRQTLRGAFVYDLAFRGDTVYAAAERGLFASARTPAGTPADSGYTWRLVQDFPGADRPESAVAPQTRTRSVATTASALWVGTEDGLLKSTDGGRTWSAFRTRVPTDPATPTEAVPEAETYAYPNPFSPYDAPSGVTRVVIEDEAAATATVRLYDFSMRLVRELSGDCAAGGRCEIPWDGTDTSGARVANGVYFYEVETDDASARGKIMVLE